DQIKLRGYRIEPGEVEVLLRRHDSVRDAVIALQEGPPGEARLVAYLVLKDEAKFSASELHRFLRQYVPDPMVPSAFVPISEVPLTPNGKVDRRALPPPGTCRPELDQKIVRPRNALEQSLAGIWCGVLGLTEVGVLDSFFELGGHSLLAMQVVARVHDVLGINLPVRLVFEAPTIAEMAAAIVEQQIQEASPDELEQALTAVENVPLDRARAIRAGEVESLEDCWPRSNGEVRPENEVNSWQDC